MYVQEHGNGFELKYPPSEFLKTLYQAEHFLQIEVWFNKHINELHHIHLRTCYVFLEFKLDQEMKDNVEQSVKKFNATMQSLDVDHLEYQKYTKSYVKKSGMGPDSLMQLAIQVNTFYTFRGEKTQKNFKCLSYMLYMYRFDFQERCTFE